MFEFSPVAPTADLRTILETLDHETIADFVYEVVYDVKDLAKDSSVITECLSALRTWLDNPEAREGLPVRLRASINVSANAAANASRAASYACAAVCATAHVATHAAYYAVSAAAHAAYSASYAVDPDKREEVRQTYMSKYTQWANNYVSREVTPTHDKSELYTELSSFAQDTPSIRLTNIILDFLFDHGMEIDNDVLKYFGVKSFGNRNQTAKEIHRSSFHVKRFYHIIRTLGVQRNV